MRRFSPFPILYSLAIGGDRRQFVCSSVPRSLPSSKLTFRRGLRGFLSRSALQPWVWSSSYNSLRACVRGVWRFRGERYRRRQDQPRYDLSWSCLVHRGRDRHCDLADRVSGNCDDTAEPNVKSPASVSMPGIIRWPCDLFLVRKSCPAAIPACLLTQRGSE